MRLLGQYIGKTIATHILAVMLVLLSLYFFSTFVTEVADVGQGNYQMLDALQFSIMLLPRQVYELFPLVALMGTMLGLGALANTSELTVMRASGISVQQILREVLKVGAVMVVIAAILGEFIAPPLEKEARLQRARAVSEKISVNAKSGLWAREGETFINIERLLTNGRASGIHLYRFDAEGRLLESTSARQGTYKNKRWQLQRVLHTNFEGKRITRRFEKSAEWKSSLTPEVIDVVAIPPENLSILDLRDYIRYLRENELEAQRYELSYWVRIVTPFATAGMILLAIPFVFGSLRSVGIGQRIVIGALIGIGFYLFNGIFSRLGVVYNLSPIISALTPTLMVYLSWLLMMWRLQK
jgi:lipopolysaccharide export system permease protein